MAKTGLPNFSLRFTGPWRGISHTWSVDSSHSGSALTTEAAVLTLLNAIHQVIVAFIDSSHGGDSGDVWLTGWSYYNGTTAAALWETDYASSTLANAAGFLNASGTSYGAAMADDGSPAPPEVCVRLQAPVGNSSTGKPVFLRKFIHYTSGGGESPSFAAGGQAIAAKLGNGDLPGSRVLTSPGGKQGSWSAYTFFSNHQMQRKAKTKKGTTAKSTSGLLGNILAGAAGSTLVETLLELISV